MYILNETNVDSTFPELKEFLRDLIWQDFAGDETAEDIHRLMGEWMVQTFPKFNEAYLASGEQDNYSDANQWHWDIKGQEWWLNELDEFSTEQKITIAYRLRNTIYVCVRKLLSGDSLWNEGEIIEEINSAIWVTY